MEREKEARLSAQAVFDLPFGAIRRELLAPCEALGMSDLLLDGSCVTSTKLAPELWRLRMLNQHSIDEPGSVGGVKCRCTWDGSVSHVVRGLGVLRVSR